MRGCQNLEVFFRVSMGLMHPVVANDIARKAGIVLAVLYGALTTSASYVKAAKLCLVTNLSSTLFTLRDSGALLVNA